jgi:hypothetical protein
VKTLPLALLALPLALSCAARAGFSSDGADPTMKAYPIPSLLSDEVEENKSCTTLRWTSGKIGEGLIPPLKVKNPFLPDNADP